MNDLYLRKYIRYKSLSEGASGGPAPTVEPSRPLLDICIDFDCTFTTMHLFKILYQEPFISHHLTPLKKFLIERRSVPGAVPGRREFVPGHGEIDIEAGKFPELVAELQHVYSQTSLDIRRGRASLVGDDTRVALMLGFLDHLHRLVTAHGYQPRFTILTNGFAADIAIVLSLIAPEFLVPIRRIVSLRPPPAGEGYSRVEWTWTGEKWESRYSPEKVFGNKLQEQRDTLSEQGGASSRSILLDDSIPDGTALRYGSIVGDPTIAFFGVEVPRGHLCLGLTEQHMRVFADQFKSLLESHWKLSAPGEPSSAPKPST